MASAPAQTRTLIHDRGDGRGGDKWAKFALLLVVGYLSMGRSFAYLGLPWYSLYVSEMALAAFLLSGPTTKQGRWVSIALRLRRLKRLKWLLLLFLFYGGFEALRGMLTGYPAFTAARDTAFNYYPLFLFLGIWAGLRDGDFLRRVVRALAWWNGCYGIGYVLFLNRLPWTMLGTAGAASTVPVFSQPLGSAIALLGLLAFEPKLRRVWHLLALNGVVTLSVQARAEWVAFAVGLLVFAWCTKRVRHVVIAGALLVVLLGVMYVANVDLPTPEGRGGRISADYLVARAVAPFDRDLAASLSAKEAVEQFAGTADWRLVWWDAIWWQVHGSASSALLGFGYGYPIGDLNPFIEPGEFIRTPHNDFLYALGFSGWLGVVLFLLLQVELGRRLLQAYRATGLPFGLMCWAALLADSMFGDFFEAPMGAIPFYLLVGIALAPGLLSASVAQVPAKALARPRVRMAEA